MYKYVPEELRKDKELALIAVTKFNNGSNIEHASKELRNDK